MEVSRLSTSKKMEGESYDNEQKDIVTAASDTNSHDGGLIDASKQTAVAEEEALKEAAAALLLWPATPPKSPRAAVDDKNEGNVVTDGVVVGEEKKVPDNDEPPTAFLPSINLVVEDMTTDSIADIAAIDESNSDDSAVVNQCDDKEWNDNVAQLQLPPQEQQHHVDSDAETGSTPVDAVVIDNSDHATTTTKCEPVILHDGSTEKLEEIATAESPVAGEQKNPPGDCDAEENQLIEAAAATAADSNDGEASSSPSEIIAAVQTTVEIMPDGGGGCEYAEKSAVVNDVGAASSDSIQDPDAAAVAVAAASLEKKPVDETALVDHRNDNAYTIELETSTSVVNVAFEKDNANELAVGQAEAVAPDDSQNNKKEISGDDDHQEDIPGQGKVDIAPPPKLSSLQMALQALELGEERAIGSATGPLESEGVDKTVEDDDQNKDDGDAPPSHKPEKEEYYSCESSRAETDDLDMNNDNEEESGKADGEDEAVPPEANEIKAGAEEEADQIGAVGSSDQEQPTLQSNGADHISDSAGSKLAAADHQDVPRFIPKQQQTQPWEHQTQPAGTDEHFRALIQQELQRHSEALEKDILGRLQELIRNEAAEATKAAMCHQQDEKFETKVDALAQKLALEESFKKEHAETSETMKEFVKYQTRQLHTRIVVPLEQKVMARMGSLQMSISERLQKQEKELQTVIPLAKQMTAAQKQQGLDITTMKEQIETCLSESQRLNMTLLEEKNSTLKEFESHTARFQKSKQDFQAQLSSLQESVEKEQMATFAKIESARVMAHEEQQAQQQKFITMGTTLADEIEDLEEKMTQLQAQVTPVSTMVEGFNKPQEEMQTDIAALMVKLASIQDAVHEEKRKNQQSVSVLCRNNDMVESLEKRVAKLETQAAQESTAAAAKKKDDEHLQAEMVSQRVQLAFLQETLEDHSNASARLNQKRRVDTGSLTTLDDKVSYMEEQIDKKMKQLKDQHSTEIASMEEKLARLESRLECSVVTTVTATAASPTAEEADQLKQQHEIHKVSSARKEAQDKEQMISLQMANIALQETVARYKQQEADQQKAEMQALRETVARYQQQQQSQQQTEMEYLREAVARFQAENALLREIAATSNPKTTMIMHSATPKPATEATKEDLREIVATSSANTTMTMDSATTKPVTEANKEDLREIVASTPDANTTMTMDSAATKLATETTKEDLREIVATPNVDTTMTMDSATTNPATTPTKEDEPK